MGRWRVVTGGDGVWGDVGRGKGGTDTEGGGGGEAALAVVAAAMAAAPVAAVRATEADKAVVATLVAARGTRRPKSKTARRNNTTSATACRVGAAQVGQQQEGSKLGERGRAQAKRASREMRAREAADERQQRELAGGWAVHTKAHGQAAEGSAEGPGSTHLYELTTRSRTLRFAQRDHLAQPALLQWPSVRSAEQKNGVSG